MAEDKAVRKIARAGKAQIGFRFQCGREIGTLTLNRFFLDEKR